MKKNRRWFWIIIIVVVLLLGLFLVVRWWNRGVVTVKVVPAARGAIEAVVAVSGVVDAPVYNLGSKTGGKIASLKVKEGDRVWEGSTLLEFDDTTRIVSSNSGVVAKINYEEGETVAPGSAAIVVVNYNKSWVEAQIDEIDIAEVAIGNKVVITSDVYPDKTFKGEIYWIAPLAELRKVGGRVKMDEESYVFPCKIKFLGAHDELKANMSVNADIIVKRRKEVVIFPREALVSQDSVQTVFVVKNGKAYQTEVGIGIRNYTSAEAVSGLREGEIIAITNVAKLKNKGRVKIER